MVTETKPGVGLQLSLFLNKLNWSKTGKINYIWNSYRTFWGSFNAEPKAEVTHRSLVKWCFCSSFVTFPFGRSRQLKREAKTFQKAPSFAGKIGWFQYLETCIDHHLNFIDNRLFFFFISEDQTYSRRLKTSRWENETVYKKVSCPLTRLHMVTVAWMSSVKENDEEWLIRPVKSWESQHVVNAKKKALDKTSDLFPSLRKVLYTTMNYQKCPLFFMQSFRILLFL